MNGPRLALAATALSLFTGCAVIHADQVGVKTRLGRLAPEVYEPGPVVYNPLVSRVIALPTRTVNLEVKLDLPSSEGLNIRAEISILYSIDPNYADDIVRSIGTNYEEVMILSVFRSAAADVCARFMAKDMYTNARQDIEHEIKLRMDEILAPRGFTIENVLLKSIQLPPGLQAAIEDKLEAEQAAQRMEFVLLQEQQEAERRRIEAEGVAQAHRLLTESLNDEIIAWQSLAVFQELASSPNTKIIVTDGATPMLIDAAETVPAPVPAPAKAAPR
jgi:prohibitin 1